MKADSRRRLLDAAIRILDEEGQSALTTTRVAALAGLKQPTFYVHFDNTDALFKSLIDERFEAWRRDTLDARQRSRDAPDNSEHFRDTFRIPMTYLAAHPQLLRIVMANRLDPSSALGVWSRRVYDDLRADLILDLVAAGFPNRRQPERRRVEMIADCVMTMTAELTLGHLDGRYPDLEEAVDVLVAFSEGYLRLRTPRARSTTASRSSTEPTFEVASRTSPEPDPS